MFPKKIPGIVPMLWPSLWWRKATTERVLHLTFDDGPSPGVTEEVLAMLAAYDARATFFSIGDKVRPHAETLLRVQAAGHAIGNHTHNHLNLWRTPLKTWLANVAACQAALAEVTGAQAQLMRPPYGRMTPRAAGALRPTHQVVMWDVICGDWDHTYSPDKVAANAIRYASPGSIVVLHDSDKAAAQMLPALPRILAHFKSEGYRFESLI